MFLRLLPEDFIGLYSVVFTEYAERNFRKQFAKRYKDKIWGITEKSIVYDLERIQNALQRTQQVDQLFQKDSFWIFKYDFAVAKSGKSPKASGNRCVCFLDDDKKQIKILLIYSKDDLPKNKHEQAFIIQEIGEHFLDLLNLAR